ncbi:putative steroid-binding protein 3 [Diplonema papillatum]|nr:putative steroid-binding protein 3 [Diplonema papillatum]KAJ9453217.1 putative steroid-binding protein 3 [Diplonema papillatum]
MDPAAAAAGGYRAEGDGWLSWAGPLELDLSDYVVLVAAAIALLFWQVGGVLRRRREATERAEREAVRVKMTVASRSDWTLADIAPYTGGTPDDPGPILFAAKNTVFNVWRGADFYDSEGVYHCFAGRDATIMLALELLEAPTPEQRERPLTRAELSVLDDWFRTMAWKYDDVGTLAPTEGEWKDEPAKRERWAVFTAKYMPVAVAAAISVSMTTAVCPPPPKPASAVKRRPFSDFDGPVDDVVSDEQQKQMARKRFPNK